MKAVQDHIEKLGMTGKDVVSGTKGVITSLNFDLYGCIQYLITPKAKKDGTRPNSCWFDVTRVKITDEKRVMSLPDFDAGYVAEGKKGANNEKPLP